MMKRRHAYREDATMLICSTKDCLLHVLTYMATFLAVVQHRFQLQVLALFVSLG